MRVDVVFRDVEGVRWAVRDWSIITGLRCPRTVATNGDFREFRSEDGRRRVYRFREPKEDRSLTEDNLAQQLAVADPKADVPKLAPGTQ